MEGGIRDVSGEGSWRGNERGKFEEVNGKEEEVGMRGRDASGEGKRKTKGEVGRGMGIREGGGRKGGEEGRGGGWG